MTAPHLLQHPPKHAVDLTAAEVMRREVLLADSRTSVTEVVQAMREAGVQHAVVLLDGACVGVVEQDELWVAWSLEPGPGTRRSVLPLVVPAPSVSLDTAMPQLCQVLLSSRFGAVMVLDDDGSLQGLVTTEEVLRRLADEARR